ncbi:MAG: Hsp33 family molecular chaperone HslO [Wenzhouxiangellaceae bacterium]|nr:Hsp33 family molecular chaperone HslO [Wenzhouxiangellaceae bacterium]
MNTDSLQRLLLEQANSRCVVVRLDEVYREILERGRYPDPVAKLLGETLAIVALCSSGIKLSGRISLQLRSSSGLRLLMADCTDDGGLRGLARFDAEAILAAPGFRELTEGGLLTMTVEPSGQGSSWQGIVPLEGASMSAAIARYFDQSEQLPTLVKLAVTDQQVVGVLLQRMPGEAPDTDGWNRVRRLFETLSADELLNVDSETLLHRLFHDETRRLFEPRPLVFHCPCSRERVESVLRGLGADELDSIVEAQGAVDVSCEFCNEQYRFDRLDVGRLLHSDLPEDADGSSTLH